MFPAEKLMLEVAFLVSLAERDYVFGDKDRSFFLFPQEK